MYSMLSKFVKFLLVFAGGFVLIKGLSLGVEALFDIDVEKITMLLFAAWGGLCAAMFMSRNEETEENYNY